MTTDPFAELGGLRRLAQSLARDEADADDLLQDVAVIALEHPPKQDRPARPWLAKVIVNRWRMELRAGRRRRAREAAIEPDEPEAIDPLERAQTLQRLGDAVVALPASYREVVIAHYFDAKPLNELASELGVPAVTVRSRLLRAREQLRAALDESAPRRRWQRALVPLAMRPGWFAGSAAGVRLVLLVLSLVAGTWLVVTRVVARDRDPEEGNGGVSSHETTSRPAMSVRERPAFVEPAGPQGGAASGRVTDEATGAGVANAELTFASDAGAVAIRTGDAGQFELVAAQPGSYRLEQVTAAGYFPYAPVPMHPTVHLELSRDRAVRDLAVFLTPDVAYRGRVVDEIGRPVGGVKVGLVRIATGEPAAEISWTSDAEGRFMFHAAEGAVLEASAGDRRGRAQVDSALAITKRLEIKIARMPPPDATITGRVVDDDGQPIADAFVRAVPDAETERDMWKRLDTYTTSGPDGAFALTGLYPGAYNLFAEVTERAPTASRHVAAGAREVTLTLTPGEPLAGRVVTRAGVPVPVFTVLVRHRDGAARELVTSRAIVDTRGRFAVRVEPGRYDIVVFARGWAPTAPTLASPGQELELVVSEGAHLSGRVVSAASGAPIVGARVAAMGFIGHSALYDPKAITRTDGSFELGGLAAGRVSIGVIAENFDGQIDGSLVADDGRALGPVAFALAPMSGGPHPVYDYFGIGITTTVDGNDLLIEEVYPGGSAFAAGLVAGDRIATIDGESVAELGSDVALTRIYGPPDTSVALGLRRDGAVRTVVVPRVRRKG